jgi:radical SAM protein with 4Fe4S-binding SPASM domain
MLVKMIDINNHETIKNWLERTCTEKRIPLYAIFELTYKCNLRCRHCYTPKDFNNELSLGEIKAILDQLVKMGTFNLVFTGGEILAREDFLQIASAAKAKGFLLVLMTNGTLINRDNADKIGNLKPIGVEISLYGANERTHDFITRTPGSFKQVVDAIKLLVAQEIRVITKTVIMNSNVKERKDIEDLSIKLGAIPSINVGIIPRKDGSLLPLKHDLSFEDSQFYFTQETRYKPRNVKDPMKKLACKAGKAVCSISPVGDVSPCLLMPVNLGNLRDRTMAQIWHQEENEILNKIRSSEAYKSSICLNCESISFCMRCPGAAYLETGDPFGPSPSACRYAKLRRQAYVRGGD